MVLWEKKGETEISSCLWIDCLVGLWTRRLGGVIGGEGSNKDDGECVNYGVE